MLWPKDVKGGCQPQRPLLTVHLRQRRVDEYAFRRGSFFSITAVVGVVLLGTRDFLCLLVFQVPEQTHELIEDM